MIPSAIRHSVRFRITATALSVFGIVAFVGALILVQLQDEAIEESLEEAGTGSAEVFEDADEATATLKGSLSVGIPIVFVFFGLTVWVLVGRTLAPVESIRSEVETLGDGRWDGRVPESGTGDEIDRLARTMNEMLARLERSSERQRRFVGDASHELRSPLTRLRAEIEVVQADDSADRDAALAETLQELVELSALVEDLLALARLDAGRPVQEAEVDLDVVTTQVISPYRTGSDVRVDGSRIEATRTTGDERLLRRAIDNLVRNAARHATSLIAVETSVVDTVARISVSDDGPGVPPADRERIFERFTRLDDARSRDEGGAGLGLAICRDIVESHGGTVTLTDAPEGGARFTIELPARI